MDYSDFHRDKREFGVSSELLTPELFGVSALGLGGPALAGLWWLRQRSRSKSLLRMIWTAAWLGLAIAAGLTALCQFAPAVWGPLTCLASVAVLCQLSQSHSTTRMLERLLELISRPLPQALTIVLITVGAAVGWSYWIDSRDQLNVVEDLTLLDMHAVDRTKIVRAEGVIATTDRGRPVGLYVFSQEDYAFESLVQSEKRLLHHWNLEDALIRVADPDPRYNCHGWTFTGGQYWLRDPADVEAILSDNGYQRVNRPRINDVVVYRDALGKIIHTGIVRSAPRDGLILIESKWGTLGRYIHKPDVTCYRGTVEYYRTQRTGGHLVRGLGNTPPVPLASLSVEPINAVNTPAISKPSRSR